jgi:hypothetical protein
MDAEAAGTAVAVLVIGAAAGVMIARSLSRASVAVEPHSTFSEVSERAELPVVHEFPSAVAGVSFTNSDGSSRQRIIKQQLVRGTRLLLRFEDGNPYGADAVAVFTPQGAQIGYLRSNVSPEVRGRCAAGEGVSAFVAEITGGEIDRPTLGVNILVRIRATPPAPREFKTPIDELVAKAYETPGGFQEAESALLADIARREKRWSEKGSIVASAPYERLARLYHLPGRYQDAIAVLERYLALPEAARVANPDRIRRLVEEERARSSRPRI